MSERPITVRDFERLVTKVQSVFNTVDPQTIALILNWLADGDYLINPLPGRVEEQKKEGGW